MSLSANAQTNENSVNVAKSSYSEEKNYYDNQYLMLLESSVANSYDDEFRKCFFEGKVFVGETEYPLNEIYLVAMVDESIHVVSSRDTHIDLITGEYVSNDFEIVCNLRESSAYWKLYQDGFLKNRKLELTSMIKEKYFDNWDLDKHEEVLELTGKLEASRRYQRHFQR